MKLDMGLINQLNALDKDGVKVAHDILRSRWNELQTIEARKFVFRIGQKVSFVGRNAVTEVGNILKVNIKTVKVQTENGIWNVPPSMLTLVE